MNRSHSASSPQSLSCRNRSRSISSQSSYQSGRDRRRTYRGRRRSRRRPHRGVRVGKRLDLEDVDLFRSRHVVSLMASDQEAALRWVTRRPESQICRGDIAVSASLAGFLLCDPLHPDWIAAARMGQVAAVGFDEALLNRALGRADRRARAYVPQARAAGRDDGLAAQRGGRRRRRPEPACLTRRHAARRRRSGLGDASRPADRPVRCRVPQIRAPSRALRRPRPPAHESSGLEPDRVDQGVHPRLEPRIHLRTKARVHDQDLTAALHHCELLVSLRQDERAARDWEQDRAG